MSVLLNHDCKPFLDLNATAYILNYLINILTPLQLILLVTSHTYSALLFIN